MPVLSYASLTLKPHYLDLLERFYLPIGTGLRPALKSLVLALLPGIDEEGGEYFDRTLSLIDSIREKVQDDAYFWQCVLLATITATARRQGALAFLAKRLPRLRGAKAGDDTDGKTEAERTAEADALTNPEPGLLVRAFCAGLGDEQLLVQRGFLDLLVSDIPLATYVLQEKVSKPDLQMLVTSAAGVVMRREMSLNRRLWAWFLGPDEANAQEYFEKNALQSLTDGLLKMFNWTNTTSVEKARPYRICLSLMDRWEVGSLVVPNLFLPAIESLRKFEMTMTSKELYAEVLRSASMFFDGVEAGLIWGQMIEKINTAFTGDRANSIEHLQGVRFIIRTFNVQEEEMVLVHAPMAVLILLQYLEDSLNAKDLRIEGFLLAEDIWNLIPGIMFKAGAPGLGPIGISAKSAFNAIHQFYQQYQARTSDESTVAPPFQLSQVAERIFMEIATAVRNSLAVDSDANDVEIRCRLFVNVAQKVPKLNDWVDTQTLILSILAKLKSDHVPFGALQGMTNMIAAMFSKGYISNKDTDELVVAVTKPLWIYLSPDTPKFHVETVKTLWNLQNSLGDRRVEAAIATVMTSPGPQGVETGRNLGILWMHSVGDYKNNYHMMLTRPLFLFLDSLVDDGSELAIFARGWLQSLPSITKYEHLFMKDGLLYAYII